MDLLKPFVKSQVSGAFAWGLRGSQVLAVVCRCALQSTYSLTVATLVVLIGSSVAGGAQMRHGMSFEDSASLKQVRYFRLSHNGNFLAYVLDGDIWLASIHDGSKPRRVAKGSVPLWSPDDKYLAYYAGESGTFQLSILEVEFGRTEQVTQLEGGISPDPHTRLLGFLYDPLSYSWSPDGMRLVFPSQVPSVGVVSQGSQGTLAKGVESPFILTTETPHQWTLFGVFSHGTGSQQWIKGNLVHVPNPDERPLPKMVNQIFLVNISTRKTEQLTNDDSIYFNPDWSPDGRSIVVASSEGRSLDAYGSGTTNIYAIDLANGKKKALTATLGDKRLPSWSPDGKWIAYLGREHFGMQSVFVVPTSGGKPINITSDINRSIQEFHWSGDSRSIVVSFADGVSTPIARVAVPAGGSVNVACGKAVPRWPMVVTDSGSVAWQQSDGSSLGVIQLLIPGADSPRVLVDLNPQIKEWELGDQEVIRWKSRRGDQMEGILIKPVGYRKGHKYPLIVDCYPGVQNHFFGYPMSGNQELASRGYAVFYPNARTPYTWMNPFKTEKHDQAARGPSGWKVTVDDVMSGVDELIHRGIVDPARMGLYGFSNGSGIVNYLITTTGRFKCAVSVASVLSDWSRSAFLDEISPWVRTLVGKAPWDAPRAYTQLSVIYRLNSVTTPLLLANGDDDVECLLNTIEIYKALRSLGRDVTVLRYPGQGHVFTGAAVKDFRDRELAFFDKYLKPELPVN
jgi:dipeptidyl aminopeptidase/acylaminoacyl peptidase